MAVSRLEFRVLGPLAVRVDGVSIPVGGPKQRGLLAMLLLSPNRVVSRNRLIAELFPDQTVDSADHALRNHVSRLRKVFAAVAADEPRLLARPPGYLLRVEPGELDLQRFERLVADGREALEAGESAVAAGSLRAAEALWTGQPLGDLEFEAFTSLEVERLEELRLAAVEERIEAELRLGRQVVLVPELEKLAVEHPLRERFHAQLMLAFYRSGRQADALEVYRRTRTLMHDELGLEPSVELQQLERAILVQDAALDLGVNGAGAVAPRSSDVCPFKGLAPFEMADAEFFFGRERLVDELLARLAEAPLLTVVGASGSGKSSLLQAGLLSAVDCPSLLIRPGERPAAELATAIAQAGPNKRLMLAVDQFEELFAATIPEDERRAFVDSLVEAAWDPDRRVLVVIALRADFFGRLATYAELADLIGPNQVLLGPMSASELRRAIEGPAERTGLAVEPALVDTLVDEVAGETGGLPLLSTTLFDLWRKREGDSLRLATYERTGGVRAAVARHAESAFESLTDEEQAIARRIMLRLVAGGNDQPLTRRRVRRVELDGAVDEQVANVLAALVERRLLVADDGTVELVHEALLERWPRLAEWLKEDVEGRLLQRHVTQAAADWENADRDPSALYRGTRLTAALDWAGEHAPDLNQSERQFLDESRAASMREAGRQRRTNRRLRALLAGVVTLLVLSVVAAAFALEKRGQARRDATAAVAQRLGTQALIDPSLDRSLLLAREGINLDDSEATRSNLLAALLRSPAAIAVLREGSDRLLDEALSPDGRTLAVRGNDGNVVLFNTRTLRRIRTALSGTNEIADFGGIDGLAFSPDGSTLVVGGTTGYGPGQAAIVDLLGPRGDTSMTSQTSADITADVAFAPDGQTFATGERLPNGNRSVIVVRDARTARARAQTGPIPVGILVGYTRDGRSLLVVTGWHSSMLLDARTLKRTKSLAVGGFAALSPASDEAAFGHPDGSVTLLDLHNRRTSILAGRASGLIYAVTFSPDGGTLAAAAEDGTVSIWNVHTGTLRQTLKGHSEAAEGVVFSPDGRTLYTASLDGSVIAWDLQGTRRLGQPFRYSPPSGNSSVASAVSPNGSLFALSPAPDRIRLWRTSTRTPAEPPLRGPVGYVGTIAISPDGRLIAAAGTRHAVVWDMTTKDALWILPTGSYAASQAYDRYAPGAVAFSPDGRTLAVGSPDGIDTLYDLRTGRQKAKLHRDSSTTHLAFSPDGKLLASGGLGGTVTVWSVARHDIVSSFASGALAALTVGFSPDGKLIAVGDDVGRVAFWQLDRKHQVLGAWAARRSGRTLATHSGVTSLDFDPQGKTLATLSNNGHVELWDLATRNLIGAPLPGSNTDGSVHFFPNGKYILSVFRSGRGILWNVDSSAWKARACSVAHRNLSRGEWSEFLGHRRYRDVCP